MSTDPTPSTSTSPSAVDLSVDSAEHTDCPIDPTVETADCPDETAHEFEKTPVKVLRDGKTPGFVDAGVAAHATDHDDRHSLFTLMIGRDIRGKFAEEGAPPNWHLPLAPSQETSPLMLEWACDVTEERTSWLWPGRIPFGRLTLLAGADGRTASLVAMDLAARLSRGAAWPDGLAAAADPAGQAPAAATANVIYFGPHRDMATRYVPGLRRASADMGRVLCLDGICTAFEYGEDDSGPRRRWRPWQIPRDTDSLRLALGRLGGVKLVVLDPIEAFLDPEGNARTPRRAADALREVAWDFGVAIVAVTRLKPMISGRRAVPSIENPALAEMAAMSWAVLSMARSERQHLLLPVHCELEGPGAALTFELGAGPDAGRVDWNPAPFEMTAADFAEERNAGIKFAIAASWLKGLLTDGPMLTQEIKKRARDLGISTNMLRNIQVELKVRSEKAGFQAGTTWRLPSDAMTGFEAESPVLNVDSNGVAPVLEDENALEPPTVGEGALRLEETAEISNGGG